MYTVAKARASSKLEAWPTKTTLRLLIILAIIVKRMSCSFIIKEWFSTVSLFSFLSEQ
jgi:hypothetical protein